MRETCGLNPSAIPLHAHIDDVTRYRSSLSMPTGFIPGYRRVRILLILIYTLLHPFSRENDCGQQLKDPSVWKKTWKRSSIGAFYLIKGLRIHVNCPMDILCPHDVCIHYSWSAVLVIIYTCPVVVPKLRDARSRTSRQNKSHCQVVTDGTTQICGVRGFVQRSLRDKSSLSLFLLKGFIGHEIYTLWRPVKYIRKKS